MNVHSLELMYIMITRKEVLRDKVKDLMSECQDAGNCIGKSFVEVEECKEAELTKIEKIKKSMV